MRDDLTKEKLPASVKRYARMKSPLGTSPKKFNLFNQATAELTNVPAHGFKNKSDGRTTAGAKLAEQAASVVDRLLAE
jgi:hypothetical protein